MRPKRGALGDGCNPLPFLSNSHCTLGDLNEPNGLCTICLLHSCFHAASLRINDDFIFFSLSHDAFRCHRGNLKQLGHSMGFSYEYKSLYFQMRFCRSAFLQNSKFKNSAKHCCIDNSVTTKFFFGLYFLFLLPRPPLLPLCRKNMKYLSGHRVLNAQLLHGNVAGIPDNGLQRWAKQPFFGTFFYVSRNAVA